MPLTGVSVREGDPTFVRVAVVLPLELIFLFNAEIILPASFGLTMAGSNEAVGAVDEKQRPSEVRSETASGIDAAGTLTYLSKPSSLAATRNESWRRLAQMEMVENDTPTAV